MKLFCVDFDVVSVGEVSVISRVEVVVVWVNSVDMIMMVFFMEWVLGFVWKLLYEVCYLYNILNYGVLFE